MGKGHQVHAHWQGIVQLSGRAERLYGEDGNNELLSEASAGWWRKV